MFRVKEDPIYTLIILKDKLDRAEIARTDLETLLYDIHDYILPKEEHGTGFGTCDGINVQKMKAVKAAIARRVEEERLKKLAADVDAGNILRGRDEHVRHSKEGK